MSLSVQRTDRAPAAACEGGSRTRPLRVIYIAGYGRSGSTLLERVLGSHPAIRSSGELANLVNRRTAGHFWDLVADSAFWSHVRSLLQLGPEDIARLHAVQRRHESVPRGLFRYFTGSQQQYQAHIVRTFQSLLSAAPAETEYVVDSSKTTRATFFRPHLIARLPGIEVKVIHLIREGRGCLQSVLKGSNMKMEMQDDPRLPHATLRACLSWVLANASGFLYAVTRRNNYMKVRYEEFIADPVTCLGRIETFLGVDLSEQKRMLEQGEPIPPAEQFAGNRMRLQSDVRLKRHPDRVDLHWAQRICFWVVCWPIVLIEKVVR